MRGGVRMDAWMDGLKSGKISAWKAIKRRREQKVRDGDKKRHTM